MDALVHRKERLYFRLSLVLSLLIYLVVVVSIVGLLYIGIGMVIGIVAHGLFVGSLRLAHIKRRHLTWRWALYPVMLGPFLGSACSRACEYTCDRFGVHCRPSGAAPGLLVLAVGKRLYRPVGSIDFGTQAETERGFWVSFAEILSTHPNLPKRVRAVVGLGAPIGQEAGPVGADALK